MRLIGVSLSGLTNTVQQSLFDEPTTPAHPYLDPAEPMTPAARHARGMAAQSVDAGTVVGG